MDQSEADWGDWSLNNDEGIGQLDIKQELVDDEQRLIAYDEEPQKEPVELRMYDDDAGLVSGSGASDASDLDDLDEGSDVHKELLDRTERGPLGQLQPQGMVMCEFCGRLGVRDAFYSKTKRFCSVNCSKNFASSQKDGKPTPFTLLQASMAQKKPKGSHSYLKSQYIGHGGVKFGSGSATAFDWSNYMNEINANAAPVSCFQHCIMSESWDNIAVGMKVEVTNTDCETEAYWIATVIQLAGYRAQMRYEGFGNDSSLDFWKNLCSKDIHPVGWCAANGKPLVPPNTIIHKYLDWKDFLVKRLTGARTLPQNFYTKVQECLKNTPIKQGMLVEVVDKMCVSAMRVARVEDIIGGRLKLLYVDSKIENDEFWCHQDSPLVHPVGWSQMVGHKLHATAEYKADSLRKYNTKTYEENDSTPDMFKKIRDAQGGGGKFQVGMKLEAIDPLNLSSICVATVTKVLRHNFVMIGIDGSMADTGADWFCYHASSPCIFPVGFCEINNLDITPPRGYKGAFKWFDYLKETKSSAAPVKLFDKAIPRHGFKSAMKIEAVDLMEPRLICVATVRRVVGRLLRVHFDGWEDSYDQWVDCHSADIYPVGWCEMVGYHLEGPRPKESSQPQTFCMPRKRKSKSQMYRGPRKKRKPKLPLPIPGKPGSHLQNSLDSSDISQDSFSTATSDNQQTALHGMSSISHGCVDIKQELPEPGHHSDVHSRPAKSQEIFSMPSVKPATDDNSTLQGVESSASPHSSPQRVPLTATRSALASSMPSITNILNSPMAGQQQPGPDTATLSNPVSKLSPHKASTVSITALPAVTSPSTTLSPTHVFTVQKVQGQSSVYTLSSPTSSPGAGSRHMTHVFRHNIPRVLTSEPESDCVPPIVISQTQTVEPLKWGVMDVCQFLKINDSGAHSDCFRKKKIDGPKFLALSKEQIVNLTGMRVGPSLKIHDLIQILRSKIQLSPKQKADCKEELTCVTASVLLKQQGLLQQKTEDQQEATLESQKSNPMHKTHMMGKTTGPQHPCALKAQVTQ